MRRLLPAAVLAVALALLVAGPAAAAETKLRATVGPGFTIALFDASGKSVSQLDPGVYEIEVEDESEIHNFRLRGPGVDVSTGVEFVGSQTFRVTLQNGAYTFLCDPHPTTMRGTFTVGTTDPPVTGGGGGGGGGAKVSAPVGAKLVLTVGPGFTIGLKTTAGKRVTTLKRGRYTIVVRDRSRSHNAHLRGAGVNKVTGVPFTGTKTFRVVLRKGTLAYVCDPHAGSMRGAVKVL